MRTLTSAEKEARAAAVVAECERGVDTLSAIKIVNRRMFGETARPPARRIAETAPPRPAPPAAQQQTPAPPRRSDEELRQLISAELRESSPTAPVFRAPPEPERPLHKCEPAEVAAATFGAIGRAAASPFWRRESAPAAPVTESEIPAPPPAKPLHLLTSDELLAVGRDAYGAQARAGAFASPGWVA